MFSTSQIESTGRAVPQQSAPMLFLRRSFARRCAASNPGNGDTLSRRDKPWQPSHELGSMHSIYMTTNEKTKNRVFAMNFAKVYPLYVAKAEKKGRKKSEVDAVIC